MVTSLHRLRISLLFSASLLVSTSRAPSAEVAPWIPDLQNGDYRNPVLYADYSDPDAIRVGEDFYLIASSFSHVPGLPILHSKDLVNWSLLTYALPVLTPKEHFSVPRPGEGVWAPALRFHEGKFWIYYPDPDFGIYLITAAKPEGPWSEPILVKAGKGLIDPCPFWDQDGQLYLIHGWALSRSGVSNRLTLVRLSADGTHYEGEEKIVVEGAELPGWRTLEGPKLYQRNGYYYIFAPAGGVKTGWQAVFRAKSLFGPYENRIVMDQGSTPINGPHQGAWVDTPSGQDWFLHFQDQGPYGRVVHLQPLVWKDDWPVIGEDPEGDGKGQPVLVHAKPTVPSPVPVAVPVTSDEFESPQLALSWQWQANPAPDWFSLTAVPGALRLTCVPTPGNLLLAPNLLLQKFPAPVFEATTELKLSSAERGDQAGLVVFGYDYAWVGLRNTPKGAQLFSVVRRETAKNALGVETALADVKAGATVWLRVQVREGAVCAFAYSLDGKTFSGVKPSFQASPSRWVGAKVGIFAARPSDQHASPAGYAEFSWFRLSPLSSPESAP